MIIPPFKTLVINDIPIKYRFFTNSRGEQNDLQYDIEGKYLRITSEFWKPGYNDLGVDIDFSVSTEKIKMLYDDQTGVALNDTILGIGVSFKLPNTNYQYSISVGEISKEQNEDVNCKVSQIFPERTIRFELIIEVFVYFKENSKEKKCHYADVCGAKVCKIDEIVLRTGGDGLLFPIVLEKIDGGPLWWITTELDDDSDLWDESFNSNVFALHLNQSHKQFYQCREITKNGKTTISQLFFEIIVLSSSALINCLNKLNEESLFDSVFDQTESDSSTGTVRQVVRSLIDKITNSQRNFTKEFVKNSSVWEINKEIQCGLCDLFDIIEVEDGME